MRMLLVPSLLLAFASTALADDLKGKFPKKFVKDADGETPKDRWAFGTKVLPTKRPKNIQFGDWIDDKQEYFTMSGIMPMYVRKDNGDGWVRIHDWHREGWVQKEDLVTKEDAPIFWDKAVKANPKDTFALFMRGCGWQEKGELDNALADFNECIRLNPAWAENYIARGMVWHYKKEYDKAIADYTEATRLDPKYVHAYYNRGAAWSNKKDYDKAIADFTEAIRLDPKFVFAFRNRGKAWSNKKEYDKAIADYTEAIRLDPKYVSAYNNRGIAWRDKKEYEKAIADYTEALRLDPKYVDAYDSRGLAWHLMKKYDKAIADFDESLKLDAKSVFAIGVKAMSLAGLKKYDAAVDHFEKALRLEQKDWVYKRYAFFRATCHDAKYRDGKKAVELAKLAIEKAGQDADWGYSATLAAAYAEAGDFDLAVTEQRKVLDDKQIDATDKKEQEARLALYREKKPYRDE